MGPMRAFIAVDLPEGVVTAVDDFLAPRRDSVGWQVRIFAWLTGEPSRPTLLDRRRRR